MFVAPCPLLTAHLLNSLLHLSTRNCIIALPELNKPEMYIIYPNRNTDSVLNKYTHSSFIMNVY